MSTSIEELVRRHLQSNDDVQAPVTWDEIASRAQRGMLTASPGPLRGLLVAVAAALILITAVGAVALVAGSSRDDPEPAVRQPVSHPDAPSMYRAVAEFVVADEARLARERASDEEFQTLLDRPVVYVVDHPDDIDMFDCEGETSSGGAFECIPIPEMADTEGGEIRRDRSLTGNGPFSNTVLREIEAALAGLDVEFIGDRDEVLGDYVFGGRQVEGDGALLRFGQIYESDGKRLVTVRCLGCGGFSQDRMLVLEREAGRWGVRVDNARHFD